MTGKAGFAFYYPEIKDLIQKRTKNYLLVLTVGNFSRFTVDRVESDTKDAQIQWHRLPFTELTGNHQ